MGGQLWAKIALNLADNPKVIGLSDAAFRAFIEAILYSRQHLTDGFLDRRVVAKRWGLDVAAELTSNDSVNSSWVEVEGGFEIHHFCEYQMTNEDVERKREAQRLKGIKSGEARRAKVEQNRTKNEPNVNQNELETETETETETELKPLVPLPTAKANSETRRKFVPDDWMPSEKLLEWTRETAPSLNIVSEVERMIDWSKSKGVGYIDWNRAWKNWVKGCIERNPSLTHQPPPPKKQFGIKPEDV
jgi:hypothetical protein